MKISNFNNRTAYKMVLGGLFIYKSIKYFLKICKSLKTVKPLYNLFLPVV